MKFTFSVDKTVYGLLDIEAENEEEALKLFDNMTDDQIIEQVEQWGDEIIEGEIIEEEEATDAE